MTARITISMPDDLEDRINAQLEYGDNRSELIRELIQRGLDDMEGGVESECTPRVRDDSVALGDDLPQAVDPGEAREVVRAALKAIDADGPLEHSEIVESLGEEYSLGYDMENRDGAWWKRIVNPSIKANGCEHEPGRGWAR